MKITKDFHGVFAPYLNNLLAEKRALGLKYREEERLMHVFDKMSLEFDCSNGLSKELVLAYVGNQPHWSQSTQEHRVYMIKQIASFLNLQDIPVYMCDKTIITKIENNFKPYIFTYHQIADIFSYVDHLPSKRKFRTRIFYPVIFRMLYGCGLRISEALNLRMKDVDLTEGLLYIYNSKNHKDRVIPMDASLTERCKNYAAQIHVTFKEDDYFFKSPRGEKYDKGSVYHYFRGVLWYCGISHGGRRYGGPRLHDLRHTFCVHSLYQFIKKGIDHKAALPILSTYMGHSSLAATGKYLRLTTEVFPEISKQLELYFGHIIPSLEVTKNETD